MFYYHWPQCNLRKILPTPWKMVFNDNQADYVNTGKLQSLTTSNKSCCHTFRQSPSVWKCNKHWKVNQCETVRTKYQLETFERFKTWNGHGQSSRCWPNKTFVSYVRNKLSMVTSQIHQTVWDKVYKRMNTSLNSGIIYFLFKIVVL